MCSAAHDARSNRSPRRRSISASIEAAYLTLTSNVVVAAVQEASLRGQIAATQDIIKDQAQQLNLVRQRFALGGASQADVLTQEAQLAQTRATLPPLQKQLAQTRNQLTALAGQLPSHETEEKFDLASMRLPRELPVSLPSQLVAQRPDVRAVEAQLHAASADIGVATANQLPQFTITAALGTAATGFTNMFAPGTGVWSIAGGIAQTLFDAGTLPHKKRAAVAAFEQTAAQYAARSSGRARTSQTRCGRCRRTPMRWSRRPPPNDRHSRALIWRGGSINSAPSTISRC